jgi:hypothetical protein
MNGSYVLSKLLTDADSYDADNRAADHYTRRLEKSIGQYDQTHAFKINYVYELPSAAASHAVLGHRFVDPRRLAELAQPICMPAAIRSR